MTGKRRLHDVEGVATRLQNITRLVRTETLELNEFGDYRDIFGDLCSPFPNWMKARYDAVLALAILEHVYHPASAVANFRSSR